MPGWPEIGLFIVGTSQAALGLAWRQDKTLLVGDEIGSKSREYQDSDTDEGNGNEENSVSVACQ